MLEDVGCRRPVELVMMVTCPRCARSGVVAASRVRALISMAGVTEEVVLNVIYLNKFKLVAIIYNSAESLPGALQLTCWLGWK